jgi:ferredoxin
VTDRDKPEPSRLEGAPPRPVRVVVQSYCMGVGTCCRIAPEIFVLEDGHSQARRPEMPAGNAELWEAAASCPVSAIEVFDAASGEALAP